MVILYFLTALNALNLSGVGLIDAARCTRQKCEMLIIVNEINESGNMVHDRWRQKDHKFKALLSYILNLRPAYLRLSQNKQKRHFRCKGRGISSSGQP